MPKTVEQAETIAEQQTTEEETLTGLETALPEGAEASEAELAEKEAESKEEEEKEPEESFEDKVTRLAQSMKDKELKPVYKELNDLKAKYSEAQEQLNDKVWDRHLQGLFNEDVEKLGDDEASKRHEDRQKVAAQVKEFRLRKAEVDKLKAELDDKMPKLGAIERDQKAKMDLWALLFPEDKTKVAQLTELLKKFERAKDWDDYDLILEGIKESIKAKKKPFVPDSSQGGGATPDWRHLSPEGKIAAGLEKEKRIRR